MCEKENASMYNSETAHQKLNIGIVSVWESTVIISWMILILIQLNVNMLWPCSTIILKIYEYSRKTLNTVLSNFISIQERVHKLLWKQIFKSVKNIQSYSTPTRRGLGPKARCVRNCWHRWPKLIAISYGSVSAEDWKFVSYFFKNWPDRWQTRWGGCHRR